MTHTRLKRIHRACYFGVVVQWQHTGLLIRQVKVQVLSAPLMSVQARRRADSLE